MRDTALARLYVATFLYSFGNALSIPLVPEHLDLTFGASLRFIGLAMGIFGVMQVVLRLPLGDMADRRGRKPSLAFAMFANGLSGLLFAAGPTAGWMVPGVVFSGVAAGLFWVAANSYVFDRATDAAKATSDYTVAMSLAFLLGPVVGHAVADALGFGPAFLLTVATSAAGLALVLTLPETPPAARPRPATSSYRRAWRLLRHPALVLSAIGTFVYSLLFATHIAFFQLHGLAVGLGVTTIGLLLGGRQATAILVRLGLPALLRRAGAPTVMVVGVALLALVTALVPWATGLLALAALVAVAGAATGALIPANLMLVNEGAPKDERGLANGIYGTMLGLGNTVAPFLFGAVGDRAGLPWVFWAAAIVSGLAWLGLLAYRRHWSATARSAAAQGA